MCVFLCNLLNANACTVSLFASGLSFPFSQVEVSHQCFELKESKKLSEMIDGLEFSLRG